MGDHQRGESRFICKARRLFAGDPTWHSYPWLLSACLLKLTKYSMQVILRNENFTPPAIGGHDRANYLKLTSTRNLLGRSGQLFLLFGMLSRDPQGKLCLEDGDGRVVLDMEDAVSALQL
jgi:hypothetical protein